MNGRILVGIGRRHIICHYLGHTHPCVYILYTVGGNVAYGREENNKNQPYNYLFYKAPLAQSQACSPACR